jgi:hypothetical protein
MSRARALSVRCDPSMAASSDLELAACDCELSDEDAHPVSVSVKTVAAIMIARNGSRRIGFMERMKSWIRDTIRVSSIFCGVSRGQAALISC